MNLCISVNVVDECYSQNLGRNATYLKSLNQFGWCNLCLVRYSTWRFLKLRHNAVLGGMVDSVLVHIFTNTQLNIRHASTVFQVITREILEIFEQQNSHHRHSQTVADWHRDKLIGLEAERHSFKLTVRHHEVALLVSEDSYQCTHTKSLRQIVLGYIWKGANTD